MTLYRITYIVLKIPPHKAIMQQFAGSRTFYKGGDF